MLRLGFGGSCCVPTICTKPGCKESSLPIESSVMEHRRLSIRLCTTKRGDPGARNAAVLNPGRSRCPAVYIPKFPQIRLHLLTGKHRVNGLRLVLARVPATWTDPTKALFRGNKIKGGYQDVALRQPCPTLVLQIRRLIPLPNQRGGA